MSENEVPPDGDTPRANPATPTGSTIIRLTGNKVVSVTHDVLQPQNGTTPITIHSKRSIVASDTAAPMGMDDIVRQAITEMNEEKNEQKASLHKCVLKHEVLDVIKNACTEMDDYIRKQGRGKKVPPSATSVLTSMREHIPEVLFCRLDLAPIQYRLISLYLQYFIDNGFRPTSIYKIFNTNFVTLENRLLAVKKVAHNEYDKYTIQSKIYEIYKAIDAKVRANQTHDISNQDNIHCFSILTEFSAYICTCTTDMPVRNIGVGIQVKVAAYRSQHADIDKHDCTAAFLAAIHQYAATLLDSDQVLLEPVFTAPAGTQKPAEAAAATATKVYPETPPNTISKEELLDICRREFAGLNRSEAAELSEIVRKIAVCPGNIIDSNAYVAIRSSLACISQYTPLFHANIDSNIRAFHAAITNTDSVFIPDAEVRTEYDQAATLDSALQCITTIIQQRLGVHTIQADAFIADIRAAVAEHEPQYTVAAKYKKDIALLTEFLTNVYSTTPHQIDKGQAESICQDIELYTRTIIYIHYLSNLKDAKQHTAQYTLSKNKLRAKLRAVINTHFPHPNRTDDSVATDIAAITTLRSGQGEVTVSELAPVTRSVIDSISHACTGSDRNPDKLYKILSGAKAVHEYVLQIIYNVIYDEGWHNHTLYPVTIDSQHVVLRAFAPVIDSINTRMGTSFSLRLEDNIRDEHIDGPVVTAASIEAQFLQLFNDTYIEKCTEDMVKKLSINTHFVPCEIRFALYSFRTCVTTMLRTYFSRGISTELERVIFFDAAAACTSIVDRIARDCNGHDINVNQSTQPLLDQLRILQRFIQNRLPQTNDRTGTATPTASVANTDLQAAQPDSTTIIVPDPPYGLPSTLPIQRDAFVRVLRDLNTEMRTAGLHTDFTKIIGVFERNCPVTILDTEGLTHVSVFFTDAYGKILGSFLTTAPSYAYEVPNTHRFWQTFSSLIAYINQINGFTPSSSVQAIRQCSPLAAHIANTEWQQCIDTHITIEKIHAWVEQIALYTNKNDDTSKLEIFHALTEWRARMQAQLNAIFCTDSTHVADPRLYCIILQVNLITAMKSVRIGPEVFNKMDSMRQIITDLRTHLTRIIIPKANRPRPTTAPASSVANTDLQTADTSTPFASVNQQEIQPPEPQFGLPNTFPIQRDAIVQILREQCSAIVGTNVTIQKTVAEAIDKYIPTCPTEIYADSVELLALVFMETYNVLLYMHIQSTRQCAYTLPTDHPFWQSCGTLMEYVCTMSGIHWTNDMQAIRTLGTPGNYVTSAEWNNNLDTLFTTQKLEKWAEDIAKKEGGNTAYHISAIFTALKAWKKYILETVHPVFFTNASYSTDVEMHSIICYANLELLLHPCKRYINENELHSIFDTLHKYYKSLYRRISPINLPAPALDPAPTGVSQPALERSQWAENRIHFRAVPDDFSAHLEAIGGITAEKLETYIQSEYKKIQKADNGLASNLQMNKDNKAAFMTGITAFRRIARIVTAELTKNGPIVTTEDYQALCSGLGYAIASITGSDLHTLRLYLIQSTSIFLGSYIPGSPYDTHGTDAHADTSTGTVTSTDTNTVAVHTENTEASDTETTETMGFLAEAMMAVDVPTDSITDYVRQLFVHVIDTTLASTYSQMITAHTEVHASEIQAEMHTFAVACLVVITDCIQQANVSPNISPAEFNALTRDIEVKMRQCIPMNPMHTTEVQYSECIRRVGEVYGSPTIASEDVLLDMPVNDEIPVNSTATELTRETTKSASPFHILTQTAALHSNRRTRRMEQEQRTATVEAHEPLGIAIQQELAATQVLIQELLQRVRQGDTIAHATLVDLVNMQNQVNKLFTIRLTK